jgi:GNAT superfamily N-acetyltransferase
MTLSISPVRSTSDLTGFIRMVWPIYRNDPNWVPPLIADRKKLLDRKKNPFYRHADMELFLARRNGEVVGRIAAIINQNHNQVHHDHVGFFGFFESIDDQQVANLLFAAAEAWLAERGMTAMRGPMNPSINDEIGLLVEGFDDPPQILMTYNPPYYSRLIEQAGFAREKDLYAYRLGAEKFLGPKLERVQQRARVRNRVTIRGVNFSPREAFQRDVNSLKEIYNAAWEQNWGAVRMTDAEFDFLAADLKQVAEKDLAIIAEIDGKPIGLAIALPDINQILIGNRGGGLLKAVFGLLFQKKRITRGRILVLGVVPGMRGHGIDAVLYYEIGTRMVRGHGYTEGEASWVLEDNVMMNRAAEMMNGEIYKRYRIYQKEIGTVVGTK